MEKKQNQVKEITSCVLLAVGFLLMIISRYSQSFAYWYSTHIYRIWVNTTGRIMGWFPFSVSEVLLYLLFAWVLISAVRLLVGRIQKEKDRNRLVDWAVNVFLLACVLFFLYVVNCGMNYQRESFAESAGIQTEAYTAGELKEVCHWLTEEVNTLSSEVPRDEAGVMTLELEGTVSVNACAVEAMQNLGNTYPELSGYYPKPKGLLNPWILSIQNLSGIYSPFTVEANYNSAMTDYYIPFTACHELSHLRGFMQEQEANFIGFLACVNSEWKEFQYSGYLMGWVYCMNTLYQADYDAWEEVRAELNSSVENDLHANREFWAAYDGKVAEVSNKVNDSYLKANGQNDGVKSYNRMVDLIVALHRARP